MTTLIFILPFLVAYTILVVYAERKLSAFMQDRLGPMEVGYYGLLQTVADLLKLLQKEDIVPASAQRWLFKAAPILIFLPVFAGFAVLPLSPTWSGAGIQAGVFFLLAIISLDVVGIVAAGWGSHNKYSSLGTLRSIAQIISYEIPLGLAVICVCIISGSLDLQQISVLQATGNTNALFLGIPGLPTGATGGFLTWSVFQTPLLLIVWVIFFIASLAECNRAPFDLPEAESELVAGFHTEYSGFRFAIIMLAEYAMMLLVSLLGVILFWGSWNSPLPNLGSIELADWTNGPVWGVFWLITKSVVMVAVQIWVRWTFPRLRIDQLLNLSWKYLTPAALLLLLICIWWKLV
ncbi:MAG: NADH-quinone oxidoreductase subunit H [Cyclobacteriaceae bacterium]|nr:NADH-quinone oxidoreductase subunit H [Cyclobacteriaceae bacterium]